MRMELASWQMIGYCWWWTEKPIWGSMISQSEASHLKQVIDKNSTMHSPHYDDKTNNLFSKTFFLILWENWELFQPSAWRLAKFGRGVISMAPPRTKWTTIITFNFKLPPAVWVLLARLAINFKTQIQNILRKVIILSIAIWLFDIFRLAQAGLSLFCCCCYCGLQIWKYPEV